MSFKYKKMLEVLGLRRKDPPPRVFVSLNVFNARRPSGLSQPSTRVIVRVSIWTLLVLLLTFMIVYTILLVYVDNTFLQQSSMRGRHRKMKLTGRLRMPFNGLNGDLLKLNVSMDNTIDILHRKAVWNSSRYFNDDVKLPQCMWQAVFRILITSSPKSKSQRQAIRDSWCSPKNFDEKLSKWHCIFLVGLSKDEQLNTEIKREKEVYNDVLFGNYFDSYENLTLKTIHGFNWSVHYCPSSFIIKTDEDCFINTQLLHDFLLHHNEITHNLYAGSINKDKRMLRVVRDKTQKWYVPYKDFSEKYYYPYASGMGYIVSKDVAQKLIKESAFIKPIINEDAYIGIVIHHLGVKPISSSRFVLSPSGLSVCNFMYLFIIHDVPPGMQKELLYKALRAREECYHNNRVTAWS